MYNPLDASLLCLFWPGPFMITYMKLMARHACMPTLSCRIQSQTKIDTVFYLPRLDIYIFGIIYIYILLGLSIANTICIAIINKHMLL